MKKKAGDLLMIIGTVLVGLALFLFLYNRWEADHADRMASQVLEQIKESQEKTGTGQYKAESDIEDPGKENGETMKTMVIDGEEYIGYLSIPAIDLELPVMSWWSYEGLKTAPGRYSGSLYTHDLVIAGHNYARHFSPIKWLKLGTEVDFTDAGRQVWHYQVVGVEQLKPDQVEEMTTSSEADDWDLTLFTCSTGGQLRYAVRCKYENEY